MIINKNSLGALDWFFFPSFSCQTSLQTETGRRGWLCEGRHSTVLTSFAISWKGFELAGAMPGDAWCLRNVKFPDKEPGDGADNYIAHLRFTEEHWKCFYVSHGFHYTDLQLAFPAGRGKLLAASVVQSHCAALSRTCHPQALGVCKREQCAKMCIY